MQKIPERKIRFQTPDNYNSLSENENETWRAPHHGENESVLGSECLTNLKADGLGKRSKECQIIEPKVISQSQSQKLMTWFSLKSQCPTTPPPPPGKFQRSMIELYFQNKSC